MAAQTNNPESGQTKGNDIPLSKENAQPEYSAEQRQFFGTAIDLAKLYGNSDGKVTVLFKYVAALDPTDLRLQSLYKGALHQEMNRSRQSTRTEEIRKIENNREVSSEQER